MRTPINCENIHLPLCIQASWGLAPLTLILTCTVILNVIFVSYQSETITRDCTSITLSIEKQLISVAGRLN